MLSIMMLAKRRIQCALVGTEISAPAGSSRWEGEPKAGPFGFFVQEPEAKGDLFPCRVRLSGSLPGQPEDAAWTSIFRSGTFTSRLQTRQ